jgi:O-6-methylguanine DNA methyltransferase
MNTIVYREIETPIGDMVAGATENGCCLLEFKDRGGLDRIRERIRRRYGSEMVEGESATIDMVRAELAEYFAGARRRFSFPLDLKGSPFQKAVWSELLAIPCGERRTYGEIAAAIGRPKAVRAVGRANGDNYVAIAVPCHRVVERGGGLRGYGGGLWRKRKLLGHEARMSSPEAAQVSSGAGGDHPPEGLPAKGLQGGLDLFDGQAAPIEGP